MSGPRTPPVELEAERGFLGAMLLEPSLLDSCVTALSPEDFHKESHRSIWATLRRLQSAGQGTDLIALRSELRRCGVFEAIGGETTLAILQEEGTVATQVPSYIALIREAACKRTLLQLGGALIDGAANGRPTRDLIPVIQDTLDRLGDGPTPPRAVDPLGMGLGTFLAQTFDPLEAIVEGLLYTDGGGWIGGEEKLGKSYYAVEEALSIALGVPVCGHFEVPTRRRVLFIEEEDPPRRLHARINALLWGKGLDPTDPDVRADLDDWMRVAAWQGFSFDVLECVGRLEATCQTFKPKVIYGDVLRKLTLRDLNKSAEAGALLAILDRVRREYDVIFRLLHHYRKTQGFRVGRGSQEIGGSFQLGAWAENSLFFEPIGRKQGAVKIEVQSKDAPPAPAFALRFESAGPLHDPHWVRLHVDELTEISVRAQHLDAVLQALGTVAVTTPTEGLPGVTVKDLVGALKLAAKTVRTCLKDLETAGKAAAVGKAAKNAALWTATGA
jgi:AAA domain/DnaB-like helicase N terminal domain